MRRALPCNERRPAVLAVVSLMLCGSCVEAREVEVLAGSDEMSESVDAGGAGKEAGTNCVLGKSALGACSVAR